MSDTSVFPDPVYRETVLAPLFEGVKTHYAAHMATINKAHLVMLVETSILDAETGGKIAQALVDIDTSVDIEALTYTGEHEDYFFLVEAGLSERLGDIGGALHTARSRNDMDHTLFKMALRLRAETLLEQVTGLTAALIEKANAEATTLIVAYTHGQPAQPTTFGHYLASIIEGLNRDAARLNAAIDGLDHCPMGAAAITTSGFKIDRSRMAALLGFEGPMLNSYGCIASVDYITGLYSAIKLVFLHLGRVIQDMAFWSSFEVGQLYVPNALVQISSIMPQKRNPVPIEHMRHLASVTMGRCDMMVNTMHNTPYTDMNDSEGEVQQAGYQVFESGGRMLMLLTAFLPACSINSKAVSRNTDSACITITELADTLVREERLTFRQAHEIAAHTARAVIADAAPLARGYAAFSESFLTHIKRETSITEPQFRLTVSAETFVSRRDRPGGPAKPALDDALIKYTDVLVEIQAKSLFRKARISTASDTLSTAFTALLEI